MSYIPPRIIACRGKSQDDSTRYKNTELGIGAARRREAPASRCHCRQLEHSFTDPEVRKALGNYIPVKVDGNNSPATTEHYHIRAYPALVSMNTDGTVLWTKYGAWSPQTLKKELE
jgi:hypothetical protein